MEEIDAAWNAAAVDAATVHVESTAWGFDEDNGQRGRGVGCFGERTLF
jgi:hypothetical protein